MFRYTVSPDVELRLLEIRHAPALFSVIDANREELRPWLSWIDSTQSMLEIQRFIGFSLSHYVQNTGFTAGIWHQGQLVGVVGHVLPIEVPNKITRLSFWLSPEYQGKGLMTQACKAMVDHSFRELKLNKVGIHCAADNLKSIAVAKRLGFKKEAVLRCGNWLNGQYHNVHVFGMLASEWKGGPA